MTRMYMLSDAKLKMPRTNFRKKICKDVKGDGNDVKRSLLTIASLAREESECQQVCIKVSKVVDAR